jgi:hypothetical protein
VPYGANAAGRFLDRFTPLFQDRRVRRGIVVAALLAIVAAVFAEPGATHVETASALTFSLRLGIINFDGPCPADAPTPSRCYPQSGTAVVRGLGKVDVEATHVADMRDGSCPRGSVRGSLTTRNGVLDFSGTARGCVSQLWAYGEYDVTFSGSAGYAGVKGSGTVSNGGTYRIAGTLTSASPVFDLTPPRLLGARNLVARATSRRGAKVRFHVTARDDVDGARHVSCRPASGTRFPIGRTRVTCRAADLSANTSTRRFFVRVLVR